MGRKRQRHQKTTTHFSETEEREKIKDCILKAFRARLSLPDQGGALIVGSPKEPTNLKHKDKPSKQQNSQNAPEKTQNGYSSDKSSSSMSDRGVPAKKKKQSTVNRRKQSTRSKHKSEKKDSEVNSAVAKHMKVARGVSYSLRPGKDVVTDRGITNMMTHARITQPVGLINTGRKSAPVRKVPLQVPEHIRKQTEADLKKILENDDDTTHPTISLTEAQSIILSHGSVETRAVTPASVEMRPLNNTVSTINSLPSRSPQDLNEFPEVLPLKETVLGLVSVMKDVRKDLYPGRNFRREVTSELLKLYKQNAPRSATPTPVPIFNKITNSGSVQRKLLDQFPSGGSGRGDQRLSDNGSVGQNREMHYEHNTHSFNNKVPLNFHFTDMNPFQPVTQNTIRERSESGQRKMSSIQSYKNSRQQPDHNLKLLANALELHKGKENRDLQRNAAEIFDCGRNQYYMAPENRTKRENERASVHGFKPGSINGNYPDFGSGKGNYSDKPVYVLKKHKAPENLQMLYENAKILQLQHKNPRQEIRDELFKDGIEKIFGTGRKPYQSEDIGGYLSNFGKDQARSNIVPLINGTDKADKFVSFLENDANVNMGRNEQHDLGPVFNGLERNTKADDIVNFVDAQAKKIQRQVNNAYEPMEVDDKIWELDSNSLISRNDADSLFSHNDLPVDRLKQTSFIGNSGDNVPSFLQTVGRESQSRSSSQCSHCSHNSSRYSGSQRGGDILSQVCSKEPDYMPSFHGGYYRDDRFDQRKNDIQVDTNAMDILDYIDSRDGRGDARPETISRLAPNDPDPRLAPSNTALVHDRHSGAGDHQRKLLETVITVEIQSPDSPKLYPRKMY